MKYFIFFVLFLFGCSSSDGIYEPETGSVFSLKIGQKVKVKNSDIAIELESVTEDSRCPTGAVCLWEGNAKVILKINDRYDSMNTSLNPKEITTRNYRIILNRVNPYPKLDQIINPDSYSVDLVVNQL